jgi:hypothetical protein
MDQITRSTIDETKESRIYDEMDEGESGMVKISMRTDEGRSKCEGDEPL